MAKRTLLSDAPVECPATLLASAKTTPAITVAVAGCNTPLALESARLAHQHGLIVPILIGDPSAIQSAANKIEWDLSDCRVETADDEAQSARTAVALAKAGECAAIMKGDVHTDVLLRAVLSREAGLRTENLLSHVFYMTVPGSEQALCITDAVLNVAPTLEQKVSIIRNAIDLLHAIGIAKPKIALLSATEVSTPAMPSSVDAAELTAMAQAGAFPGAEVYGPLAFDLAVSKEAANIKRVSSSVAGSADVLVVPNIETGNALFKMMVYFQSAAAAGIVLGAKVPIMLTSRADPAAARLASAALAVLATQP